MTSLTDQIEELKEKIYKQEQEIKALKFINKSYKEKLLLQEMALRKVESEVQNQNDKL